ncbi:copper oxidase [Brachybacterium avium]|uniref:Copper-containing nitrite reductase n=1 Tax=Brachybacterium avium TaxID=2017485 RepID=A0A220UA94_9MICO|nr:multicopper oxidase domain-containing protein [Brachybacterium avium]ASK65058.1 copper oxidase [Brachybacterium avium]
MSGSAPPRRRPPSWRLGWMLPAGIALLAGLDAALLLIGLPAPVSTDRLPVVHGMLLVLGFVGTLIALERATALARWYGFLAPALLGLGAIALIADPVPLSVGKILLVAGTAAFTLLYLPLWRRQYDEAVLTELLAAGLACGGAIRWAGGADFAEVLPWLIGFVVLTIAAERVELARITLGAGAGVRVLVHAAGVVAALLVGVVFPEAGAILLGAALGALLLWLIPHDIARRTLRTRGATRFMAAAILCGYGWLAIASAVLLLGGTPQGGAYDAVAHAVFLGFTISMIMAHATTILPAVLRIDLPYRSAFWVPLGLLQLSLAVRLGLGDALGWGPAWQLGGVLGVLALLAFLATALGSALLGPTRAPTRPTPRTAPLAHAARTPQAAPSPLPAAPVAEAAPGALSAPAPPAVPTAVGASRFGGRRAGAAVGALLLATLAILTIGTVDPLIWGGAPQAPEIATGPAATEEPAPVQTVAVTAADLRFTPDRIEVPAGTHLIIELTNTDAAMTHDLVVENGTRTARLAPGQSETLDVGVVTGDLDAWCGIAGHRQQGMVLSIVTTGGDPDEPPAVAGAEGDPAEHAHGAGGQGPVEKPAIDLAADPGAGFTPYDAELPPLPPSNGPVTRKVTLEVAEQEAEVAPGITQQLWIFGGTAPGPVLHGRVGDVFEVTLVNDGTIGHSIDFHAGELAPDGPMRTIAPGESLTYTFTAERAGIWMYHCGTAPVSAHVAAGMYGAVIIEPEDLPAVDRSYVLIQGEYYLGAQGQELDGDALAAGEPDLVVLNGYAAQYVHAPLQAVAGERVRFWVLDAGPERPLSFHVIGTQFDTVWSEGRYLVETASGDGSQALGLLPAQGGFVELIPPEPGHYPFMSHVLRDAERGAHGILEVRAS